MYIFWTRQQSASRLGVRNHEVSLGAWLRREKSILRQYLHVTVFRCREGTCFLQSYSPLCHASQAPHLQGHVDRCVFEEAGFVRARQEQRSSRLTADSE